MFNYKILKVLDRQLIGLQQCSGTWSCILHQVKWTKWLLEVWLPYDPSCPSVGELDGRSTIIFNRAGSHTSMPSSQHFCSLLFYCSNNNDINIFIICFVINIQNDYCILYYHSNSELVVDVFSLAKLQKKIKIKKTLNVLAMLCVFIFLIFDAKAYVSEDNLIPLGKPY